MDLTIGPEAHEDTDGANWVHMYNHLTFEPRHGVLLCCNVRTREEDIDNDIKAQGTLLMLRLRWDLPWP